ncbi:hypothetical protein QJQ45_006319 [Haematococcus lacustris]|nr:hypothetical protein QJQ45_006319 [Haematococcus lacustris]
MLTCAAKRNGGIDDGMSCPYRDDQRWTALDFELACFASKYGSEVMLVLCVSCGGGADSAQDLLGDRDVRVFCALGGARFDAELELESDISWKSLARLMMVVVQQQLLAPARVLQGGHAYFKVDNIFASLVVKCVADCAGKPNFNLGDLLAAEAQKHSVALGRTMSSQRALGRLDYMKRGCQAVYAYHKALSDPEPYAFFNLSRDDKLTVIRGGTKGNINKMTPTRILGLCTFNDADPTEHAHL